MGRRRSLRRQLRKLTKPFSVEKVMEEFDEEVLDSRKHRMRIPRREVSVACLGWTLLVLVVAGVGGFWLHQLQTENIVTAFLALADRAESEGNMKKAAEYRSRYLNLKPHDTEILVSYAQALDKAAKTRFEQTQALKALQKALLAVPDEKELRRRTALLAMELRQYRQGRENWRVLLANVSNDSEAWEQMAVCESAEKLYHEAAKSLESSIRHDRQRISAYARLIEIYRDNLNDADKAENTVERMIKTNPQSSSAFATRARYFQKLKRFNDAEADARQARELTPDDAGTLRLSAEIALALADADQGAKGAARRKQAKEWVQRAIELQPEEWTSYTLFLRVSPEKDARDEDIVMLRRGVAAVPQAEGVARLRWQLTELLLTSNRHDEAQREIKLLRDSHVMPALVDLLDARLMAAKGQWIEACKTLERIRPLLPSQLEVLRQADLLLADGYGQMGDTDRQLAASRRASNHDSGWAPGQEALASSLARNGQIEPALQEYRKLCALPNPPASAFVEVARFELLLAVLQPTTRRDWKTVEDAVLEAEKRNGDAPIISLLRSDMLVARGKSTEAEKVLEAAAKKDPKQLPLWIALASLALQRGDAARIQDYFATAEQAVGDVLDLRLARATFAARRIALGKAENQIPLNQQLAEFEKNTEKFSPLELRRLRRGLAEAASVGGDNQEARRRWAAVVQDFPDDLSAQLTLVQLAQQAGDVTALESLVEQVRRIEGETGLRWKLVEGVRLLLVARKGEKIDLERARRLLQEVSNRRPNWSQGAVALAALQEFAGESTQALESLLRAIDAGERDPAMIRRAAQALYQQRRYAEADRVIRKLLEIPNINVVVTGQFGRLAAETALFLRDFERSLELAKQAAPVDSKDYRDHLWRGQILGVLGRFDEAETALRQAVGMASDQPDAWVVLVTYLGRIQQNEKAKAALQQAEQKLPANSHLPLAQCHEALGQMEQAEKHYRALHLANTNDPTGMRPLGDYLLRRNRLRDAEPLLRKMLDANLKASEPDRAWARRGLALVVATMGDYSAIREALVLMDQSPSASGEDAADRRTRAQLLAALRTAPARRQAIQILEDLGKKQTLLTSDEFLLARIADANGDWIRCRDRMLSVLAVDGRNPIQQQNPNYAAFFARALLRRGEIEDAQRWLSRLEAFVPPDPNAIEIRARVEVKLGQIPDAIARLQAFAAATNISDAERDFRVQQAALMLEELADLVDADQRPPMWNAAETLWRQHATKQPRGLLALAVFLGKRDKRDEAMTICEKATAEPAESVASVVLSLVDDLTSEAPLVRRADTWLTQAIEKNPTSIALQRRQGDLRVVQARFADAEEIYRKCLDKQPRYILAMNNLAWMLSLREGRGKEALDIADRILSMTGPHAAFLDTRGLARLALADYQGAITDLEEANSIDPSPTISFHLARAYLGAGQRAPAERAWREALKTGIKMDDLYAIEKNHYRQVETALAPNQ